MKFTAAKALVRNFFYQEFLPSVLSPALLRGGNHLVLLGNSREEEYLLEAMGVPGYRVYSVEHDEAIFLEQVRRPDLKVNLYHGELTEFVTHYLQTNQRFTVLNLDICGLYRTAIDPVMTDILLFARRNPNTVVATYSNVGRDQQQLVEGLKSLAIFRWLAPEATERAVDRLYGSCRATGLSETVCFSMCLRHLFWLRSHMEHIALGRVIMGYESADNVLGLFQQHHQMWERVWNGLTLPLSYQQLLDGCDALPRCRRKPRFWDVCIDEVTLATYKADGGWRHTGWFSVYSHKAPMRQSEWLEHGLTTLPANPLRYAASDDDVLNALSGSEAVPRQLTIWRSSDKLARCRLLKAPSVAPNLAVMDKHPEMQPADELPVEEAIDIVPLIGSLALQGFNTNEVLERIQNLPGGNLPRGSVTAHIAVARGRAKRISASSQ